jgi:hypothetical protein
MMEVAPLPALNRQFTTYRLEMSGAAKTISEGMAERVVARAS